jgi:hypothetical protein
MDTFIKNMQLQIQKTIIDVTIGLILYGTMFGLIGGYNHVISYGELLSLGIGIGIGMIIGIGIGYAVSPSS